MAESPRSAIKMHFPWQLFHQNIPYFLLMSKINQSRFDVLAVFGEIVAELLNVEPTPNYHKKPIPLKHVFSVKIWVDVLILKGFTKRTAFDMIEKFLAAHLVHCPHNRSQTTIPNDNIKLQATPKGFACLENWIYNLSAPFAARFNKVRDVLLTSYNSMDLLVLSRSQNSHRLYISTALIIVLWRRMLGEEPQPYCGPNATCIIPKMMRKRPALVLNPLNVPKNYKYSIQKATAKTKVELKDACANIDNEFGEARLENVEDDVPYFIRSMIHPNSMNIMQHWDTRGMRIFRNLRFEKCRKNRFANTEVYELNFVLSGHAIWQWLMDCTTVTDASEAAVLAREMLHSGFISRIKDPVVDAVSAVTSVPKLDYISRSISRNALYQFTPRGRRLCWWGYMYLEDEYVDQGLLIEESNFTLYYANHRDQYDTDSDYDYDGAGGEVSLINSHLSGFGGGTSVNTPSSKSEVDMKKQTVPLLPPAPPNRMRAKWKWEYRACVGIDDRFNEYVDLSLIMHEPGLKLLFKETLRDMHCTAALDFIELSHKLQQLIHALRDAQGTVTRLPQLEKECETTATLLQQRFIDIDAPLELNIGERERNMWTTGIEHAENSKNFCHLEPALQNLVQQSYDILASLVINFNLSENTRKFPCLRHYIVANHTPRIKYEEMTISKPTYLYA